MYSRPKGAVAYEIHVTPNREAVIDLSTGLLSSYLRCYWASARSRSLNADSKFVNRAEQTSLTELTVSTKKVFVDDFLERDVDGYGRSAFVLGTDQGQSFITMDGLKKALERFADHEEGPIRVVIIQVGDSPEYVFVPHEPTESVARLLRNWGVDSPNKITKRPYERLHLVKLESLVEPLVKLAFPL